MTAWVTVEEADRYFSARLGAEAYWVSGAAKEAALATAQRDIKTSDEFARLEADDDPSDAMIEAVCEQALFLLQEGGGIDARGALAEQGVTISVIGESFNKITSPKRIALIAIAPRARAALKAGGYLKNGLGFRYDAE